MRTPWNFFREIYCLFYRVRAGFNRTLHCCIGVDPLFHVSKGLRYIDRQKHTLLHIGQNVSEEA